MKFFPLSARIVAAILMLLAFAPALTAGEGDGVTMRNGLMMMMKHGKAAMPMDEPVTADKRHRRVGGRHYHVERRAESFACTTAKP